MTGPGTNKKRSRNILLAVIVIGGITMLVSINNFNCAPEKQITKPTAERTATESKGEAITNFKSEIKAVFDSSSLTIDKALAEIDKGADTKEVSKNLTAKLDHFAMQINSKSEIFTNKAKDLGLSREELDRVFLDLNDYMKIFKSKFEQLKQKGIVPEERKQ